MDYRVSCNPDEIDFDFVHGFIAESYWAAGLAKATQQKAMDNSLCFAVLLASGAQVGFARVITDKATFAYLADVFIAQEHRSMGLSELLMQSVLAHPDLQGLRRMMLATRDAHGLYRQFGFTELADPKPFMELWQPDIYQSG